MRYQVDGCYGSVRWQSKTYATLRNLNRHVQYRHKILERGDYWCVVATSNEQSYDPKNWKVIERSHPEAKTWFEFIG